VNTIATSEPVRILIVDDEESILTYVDRVLSKAGYRTTLAMNGPDAIKVAAASGRLDLLLTDVMMPEMTGAELARRLRQGQPHLKVLYLTGFADQLFTEKVTLWEDEAFLEKPCSAAALLQAVSLAITGRIGAVTVDG
jgi:two-component system cell cycle sensor histidine kinase/response regulator CckA